MFDLGLHIETQCSGVLRPIKSLSRSVGSRALPRQPSRSDFVTARSPAPAHHGRRNAASSSASAFSYSPATFAEDLVRLEEEGATGTMDYRLYFKEKITGSRISPWHNLALRPRPTVGSVVNMVCEMPKGTDPKMEISTKEKFNPIKQDIKKGQLRFIKHGKLLFNYGAIPQTWEDPDAVCPSTGLKGDNDPIDVIDISTIQKNRGDIFKVKVLGVLALLDEGETDWKVIAINTEDPISASLNDIQDVEEHLPGVVSTVREWYRVYKVAEGKGLNKYAFDGRALPQTEAIQVIEDAHLSWAKLLQKKQAETKYAVDPLLFSRA
ncbi:inorganic pyrophosphatase, mitochondrial [Pelomyxa schiedti]|nr:inorganic pyrophosphatase, mitochondrial [Pelomyxa schiedti]